MLKVRLKIINICDVIFRCFIDFDFKYTWLRRSGFTLVASLGIADIRILCTVFCNILKIKALTGG